MALTQSDPQRERLRELDGWRAVSVLVVVADHFLWNQHSHFFLSHEHLGRMASFGGPLGVKVFFVISGFVICRLLILEEQRHGTVSLKAFYCRRIFRILPPFYLYLAALCLFNCLGLVQQAWRSIMFSALFMEDLNLTTDPRIWFAGHTWSLAVEEQFYLIFPTIWVLTPKKWRGRVFLGALFLLIAWNLITFRRRYDGITYPLVRAGFVCICCGVLMAIHEARLRRIAKAVPALLIAAIVVLLLLHPVGNAGLKSVLYESMIVPPAICLMLLFSLERGRWLRAFLCSRPIQAVGVTSYGIYLWQELFTGQKTFYIGPGKIIPTLLPLLCVIVPLSYRFIEKPAMHYGRALAAKIRGRSASASENALTV